MSLPLRFAWLPLLVMGCTLGSAGCSADPDSDDDSPAGDELSSPTPAPAPITDPNTPVLMISDGGNYRIQFLRTDTRAVFFEIDLTTLLEECNGVDKICALTEVRHTVHDGRDYLDMNLGHIDQQGTVVSPATVRRMLLSDPPTPVFTLRELDFSGVPGGDEICDYNPEDPCDTARAGCILSFPHDVEVLVDDPEAQHAELLVADLLAQRFLKIDLDYGEGNTCGKVKWVLDQRTEGFGPLYLPNDVDYFVENGKEYLLTSYYSTAEVIGTGLIELWTRSEEASPWTKLWRFPEEGAADMPYLNTPHAPMLYVDPSSGELLLRYGHSRGDSSFWRAGYEGSIGMARLEDLEQPPVYLYESKFPDGSLMTPTGFVRDVERLADGRFLINDSGCEVYFNCPLPGRVYIIEQEAFTPADGLAGAWSLDRSEQQFVDIDMGKIDAYDCGYATNYESDGLVFSQLGQDLKGRWDNVVSSCPASSL